MFTRVLAVITLMAAFSVSTAAAQQWSAEQQEVWQAIDEAFTMFFSGDMDASYRDYIHPDFVFWNSGNSVPGSRSTAKTLDTAFHSSVGAKWHGATVEPLTILVYDDVAAVNAYVRGWLEEGGKEPTWTAVRWTMVWKKEDGKWLQALNYGHRD